MIREEIATAGATAYFELWEKLSEEQRDNWRTWANDQILPLIPDEQEIRKQLVKEIEKHLGIEGEGKLDDWQVFKEMK